MSTTKDEYTHHRRESLLLPLQMQLSKKQKTFCCLFVAVLESTLNFRHFQKKQKTIELPCLNISEIIDFERCGYLNARKVLFTKTLGQ